MFIFVFLNRNVSFTSSQDGCGVKNNLKPLFGVFQRYSDIVVRNTIVYIYISYWNTQNISIYTFLIEIFRVKFSCFIYGIFRDIFSRSLWVFVLSQP